MRAPKISNKIFGLTAVLVCTILTGCAGGDNGGKEQQLMEMREAGNNVQTEESQSAEVPANAREDGSIPFAKPQMEQQQKAETPAEALQENGNIQSEKPQTGKGVQEAETAGEEAKQDSQRERQEMVIINTGWSEYFDEINGAAVIYEPAENCYRIYNEELASTRRSPCSTFKIISSLIALENGIIIPDDSVRTWSGETFWNEDWNRDIDFSDAFHTSCVWYFREVVDEIGQERMQEELNKLGYGNCDISDWQGTLNTNNQNPALTGFWLESSLLISPKEQTEVMERIFGDNTEYTEETLNSLKQVMLLSDETEGDISIYGKTGMGKAGGVVADCWYTGFADSDDERIYFCIYLGETENRNVSSTVAREIAVEIVSAYF